MTCADLDFFVGEGGGLRDNFLYGEGVRGLFWYFHFITFDFFKGEVRTPPPSFPLDPRMQIRKLASRERNFFDTRTFCYNSSLFHFVNTMPVYSRLITDLI